jgi:cobalt transporter subunit CbtA
MTIFRNVVFLAAAAGLLAGIVMTGLQFAFTVPLILEAEAFENAVSAEEPAATDEAAATEHEHEHEAWAPADGIERTAYTTLANLVTGFGFALVLVCVSGFAGGVTGWRAGLLWGFAGFAVFTLAPGLGLPPELPAMPVAELLGRQVWWVGTVIATGAGLALIVFRRNLWLALLGIALIVLPHAIGAPQPASHESPIPDDLHHRFVVAVTITNLVFWVALGIAVGLLRPYFSKGLTEPQQSFA